MERLRLPEPATTLWRKNFETLREGLDTICRGKEPWILGGGTVLAARYFHRRSNDIDIFIPKNNPFQNLLQAVNPRFGQAMLACGAQKIIEGSSSIKVWMNDASRIEISHLDTLPVQALHWADVDGHRVRVASNAQVMTGKIKGRSHRSPSRDIFDAAVTSALDPEALAIAINSLDEAEHRNLCARLTSGERHYRRIAPEEIQGVNEEFRWALSRGPEKYLQALRELRIEAVAVEFGDGKATAVTVRGDRQCTETPVEQGRFIATLESQGPRNWANEVGDDEAIMKSVTKAHSQRTAQWDAQWAASERIPGYTSANDGIGRTIATVRRTTQGPNTDQRQQSWRKARDEALGPTRVVLAGDPEIIEYAVNRRHAATQYGDGHT